MLSVTINGAGLSNGCFSDSFTSLQDLELKVVDGKMMTEIKLITCLSERFSKSNLCVH